MTDGFKSYHENFSVKKKEAIDYAFQYLSIESHAELGCIWNIDGAYSLYIANQYKPKRIVMADTHWTEEALKKCRLKKEIEIIQDNFGSEKVVVQTGKIDAIILFDVLIHQVDPNWDRILQMYSQNTNVFIVMEPIFISSPVTVRLLDLGRDEYFRIVPHDPTHPTYSSLFDKMYEMHPEHNRIWRDVHHVWQWGITQHDLLDKMSRLGFELNWLKNHGRFEGLNDFDYTAFAFARKRL
jgi:hypothetical protein